jgi:hypothetical protein
VRGKIRLSQGNDVRLEFAREGAAHVEGSRPGRQVLDDGELGVVPVKPGVPCDLRSSR